MCIINQIFWFIILSVIIFYNNKLDELYYYETAFYIFLFIGIINFFFF